MKWNYRVIKTRTPAWNQGSSTETIWEEQSEIYEVYYDNDGFVKCWSANPISPSGDSLYWLKWDLQKMLEATEKPIINIEDLKVGVKL